MYLPKDDPPSQVSFHENAYTKHVIVCALLEGDSLFNNSGLIFMKIQKLQEGRKCVYISSSLSGHSTGHFGILDNYGNGDSE